MSSKSHEPIVIADYETQSLERVPSDFSGESLLRKDLKKFAWEDVGKLAVLATPFLGSFLVTITRYQPPERLISPPAVSRPILPEAFLKNADGQSKSITPTHEEEIARKHGATTPFAEIEDEDERLTAFLKCTIAIQEEESPDGIGY